jgi:pullulanase/glycogen debranching enzyme
MTAIAPPTMKEGLPYPQGATWDGKGTNFALFSVNATKVPAVFGYQMESGDDTTFDERDSGPFVPKCVVVDPDFDWKGEPDRQAIPWDRTIVYETHVKRASPNVIQKSTRSCGAPMRASVPRTLRATSARWV